MEKVERTRAAEEGYAGEMGMRQVVDWVWIAMMLSTRRTVTGFFAVMHRVKKSTRIYVAYTCHLPHLLCRLIIIVFSSFFGRAEHARHDYVASTQCHRKFINIIIN